MSGREEWNEVIARIDADGGPCRSAHMARLYDLALNDGLGFLKSYRKKLGDDRLRDLIHDLLAEKLDAILAADAPRAYFCTALTRRAISWERRGDAAVVEAPPDSARIDAGPGEVPEEERRAWVIDTREALAALSSRDREIVVATALGEKREEIAKQFGTSRANVDQIVSRFRKRLGGGAA